MKRFGIFLLVNIVAVATLTLVAAVICHVCGFDLSEIFEDGSYTALFVFAFIFGMAGALISLCLSKTIVKLTMRCRTIDGSEGYAERWLVDTVGELALKAGIKMPEVAIYPGEANAFATGARRNAALVAVSTGIMEQMTREELKAVLAHEISHVSNGDMVTMALAQGIINTFVIFFSHILAHVVRSAISEKGERRRSSGGYFLHHLIVQVFQLLFGFLASLILLWYSRKREFAADEGAARLMGSPFSMVAALRRLENLQPGILPDSIKAFGITGKKSSIFSTHPSIDERVDALMNLQIVPGL